MEASDHFHVSHLGHGWKTSGDPISIKLPTATGSLQHLIISGKSARVSECDRFKTASQVLRPSRTTHVSRRQQIKERHPLIHANMQPR